ncbi:MAG: response regulator [Dehalococcoidia bacterium]|nr:response regulator [Dehalococcoidia bacterium]
MVDGRCSDFILPDIVMSEMDGYEVIKALKSNPRTTEMQILVMTGVEIDGGRVKTLSVGVAEYFTKSGGLSRLFDAAENILVDR